MGAGMLNRGGVVQPAAAAPPPTGPGAGADVPMFRGNPAHTAEQPGPGPAREPVIRWHVETGQPATSPAIVDGVVYFFSDDGFFYAVAAEDGEKRWREPFEGLSGGTPAVVDGLVYVGSFTDDGERGTLYALEAATGEVIWRVDGAGVRGSVNVADGNVTVIRHDGVLSALDAATGWDVWRIEIGDAGAANLVPAIADGVVYAPGAHRGQATMLAISADVDEILWFVDLPRINELNTTPAVANGFVFVGAINWETTPESPYLLALDATTGKEAWTISANSHAAIPAVADGVVYHGGGDDAGGMLAAIDTETGRPRWELGSESFKSRIVGPVVAGDTVYAGSRDGTLYAVAATTGDERWRFQFDSTTSAAAVVGGIVYISAGDGVYALGDE